MPVEVYGPDKRLMGKLQGLSSGQIAVKRHFSVLPDHGPSFLLEVVRRSYAMDPYDHREDSRLVEEIIRRNVPEGATCENSAVRRLRIWSWYTLVCRNAADAEEVFEMRDFVPGGEMDGDAMSERAWWMRYGHHFTLGAGTGWRNPRLDSLTALR